MTTSKSDEFALKIVQSLRVHCEKGSDRIDAFIKYNRQVEGWFKGELLKIASKMEDRDEIQKFKPDQLMDKKAGKRNIDLYFELKKGQPVWIELKHWYIGTYPSRTTWSATTYFTQRTSATPNNFINKLPAQWRDPIYMLIVTTPRPEIRDWCEGFDRLRRQHPNRNIKSLTAPQDFPKDFFIGLLNL